MNVKFLIQLFILHSIGSIFHCNADAIECIFSTPAQDLDPKLKILSQYHCNITTIKPNQAPIEFIGNHENGKTNNDVKVLFRKSSSIADLLKFDSSFCQNFENLEAFLLQNVKIQSIDENALYECNQLNVMGFFGNNIREFPENFLSANLELEHFLVGKNGLTTLPEKFFNNQKNLKILILAYNRISFLPSNIFTSLSNLQTLNLEENYLKILNPDWFKKLQNLKELNLNRNNISELPKDIFAPLENLETLYLEDNQLTAIHADSFGYLGQLTYVILAGNRISAIDEKFIDNTGVFKIFMSGNVCCTLYYFMSGNKTQLKENLNECKCLEHYQPLSRK